MQSIRAYRRFGRQIAAQLEADREKRRALRVGGANTEKGEEGGPLSEHATVARVDGLQGDLVFGAAGMAGGDLEKGKSGSSGYSETSQVAPEDKVEEKEEEEKEPLEDVDEGYDSHRHSRELEPDEENVEQVEAEERESRHDSSGHVEPIRTAARSSSRHRLGRILSQASTLTTASRGTALGVRLTGVDARDRSTNEGGDGKVFVVGWYDPNDQMNPHNWSYTKRLAVTLNVAGIGCIVGIASSIDSSALVPAAADFGVSKVVESMATGLYLVGFGVGALFAGPISETIGRNPVYITTLILFMLFIMASGLAPNIGAQLTFRFLAGFFGSTPLTCAGGSIADMWNPMERVWAFPIFANAAFTGPILGPVMSGFIVGSDTLSWRWTEWLTLIIAGLVFSLVTLFQPETYAGVILSWKAKQLRQLTGDKRYVSPAEIRQDPFLKRLTRALYRPFILTFQEPIVIAVAAYLTLVYIVLFTFFDGYAYIFQEIHGLSDGLTGLCFLGIAAGLFCASSIVPLIKKWSIEELQKREAQGKKNLPPEFRLWYSMLGGSIAIPVSLFWMGWTSDSSISIWSPLMASVLFGYGTLCVFTSCYQYVIDSYEVYSASALASVTLLRYVASGGMVVAGIPFYENVGVHWVLTILGIISAVMAPIPYIFYRYGYILRRRSKYAVTAKD